MSTIRVLLCIAGPLLALSMVCRIPVSSHNFRWHGVTYPSLRRRPLNADLAAWSLVMAFLVSGMALAIWCAS